MSPEPNLLCLEEDVFLMDSPCTSLRTARNIQQQQQLGGSQPQRYYLPFGQNSNELSMERKRLHRITLQAVQQEECSRQQQLGLMGPRTGGGQSAVASLAIGGPLETPKNGGKVGEQKQRIRLYSSLGVGLNRCEHSREWLQIGSSLPTTVSPSPATRPNKPNAPIRAGATFNWPTATATADWDPEKKGGRRRGAAEQEGSHLGLCGH